MAGIAFVLLAAATSAPPAGPAPQQSRVTASASVSVVIVRAERIGELPSPDGVQRQVHRQDDMILVEFN
jgi:hypothetical protein